MPLQKPISVIIPTKNQADLLKLCLKSFLKQTVCAEEIIVIDNNSSDDTKNVVSVFRRKLPIRYFIEKRHGPSFARNKGIMKARGKILAFIDSDCVPSCDWLENIWKSYTEEKESIIQGRWVNIPLNYSIPSTLYLYTLEVYRSLLLTNSRAQYVNFIDTKNFSIPNDIIRKGKLRFDENLILYAEDVDFGLQIINKNMRITYNPKVKVKHLIEKKWFKLLKMNFDVGRAKSLLDYKWGLKKERERKLGKAYVRLWKLQRNQFITQQQKRKVKEILRNKNLLFKLFFKSGLTVGMYINYFGQYLSSARKYFAD